MTRKMDAPIDGTRMSTIEPSVVTPRAVSVGISEQKRRDSYNQDKTWKSCCLTCDRRAVPFFTRAFITLFVMAFCMYQLVTNDSCEAQTGYTGLLTLLLGLIVPAPNIKR